jgi:hypothetical protein
MVFEVENGLKAQGFQDFSMQTCCGASFFGGAGR